MEEYMEEYEDAIETVLLSLDQAIKLCSDYNDLQMLSRICSRVSHMLINAQTQFEDRLVH